MKKTTAIALAFLVASVMIVALLSGCGRAREKARFGDAVPPPSAPGAAPAMPAEYAEEAASDMSAGAPASPADAMSRTKVADIQVAQAPGGAAIVRRIIKTGEMSLEIKSLPETVEQIKAIAEGAGGYIADTSVNQNAEEIRNGSVKIRIPAEKFPDVYAKLLALGKAFNYSEMANDVTEEWVDVEARINNRKAEEQALLALLKRKGELDDILKIQQEIFRVRGEIEQAQGRMRYLKDQVSLSTITVTLTEEAGAAISSDSPWNVVYHFKTAWHALGRIAAGILHAIIYIVIDGVFLWLLLLLIILWVRKRRARRQAGS